MAHPGEPKGGERIAKLLARAGVASRREVERMIAEGRVARDGIAIDTPATVLPSLAGVTVDGNVVAAATAARLFLYHKPPGLLVTERDPRGRPTIYDRLAKDHGGDLPRLVPVGRLDLATEGLLLLTTDGELKRALELPSTGVERVYRARVYGAVGQPALEALIEGIEIDGFRYGPIDANMERRTGANSWIELRLAEGKNREVRRVLEYLGLEVSRLIRTRYGPFVLGDLPPGAVGEVRERDLVAFRQTLGKGAGAVLPRVDARLAITAPVMLGPGAGRNPTGATGRSGTGAAPKRAARPAASARPSATARVPKPGARPRSVPVPVPVGTKRAAASPIETVSAGPAAQSELPTRPAQIQRKPGWAKPKPKAGPRKPRKS